MHYRLVLLDDESVIASAYNKNLEQVEKVARMLEAIFPHCQVAIVAEVTLDSAIGLIGDSLIREIEKHVNDMTE